MNTLTKAGNPDVYGFITYVCSKDLSAHIGSLKQKATKKKPFSFERLSNMMLPLFKYFETKKLNDNNEMKKIQGSIN